MSTQSPIRPDAPEATLMPRLQIGRLAPSSYKAMADLAATIKGFDPVITLLVKIRAPQINGCAFCIDMHTKDARAAGESEQRLYALDAWRETPFFSERERVALEWIEAVTRVSEGHVPDEVYERAREQFTEKELLDLTMAAVAINGWNRLAISTRAVPGSY